jgi:hypothetical protein
VEDDRIEIPGWARLVGIFGGLLLMVLGMLVAWARSGMSAVLPPTGWRSEPAQEARQGPIERLAEALISRVSGPPGEGKG